MEIAAPGASVTAPKKCSKFAGVMARVTTPRNSPLGPVTLQANVYNLADAGYIVSGHGTNANLNVPGTPRSFRLTARVSY